MMMKEQILDTLATMGFRVEEKEGFGYGFRYEGINYLYMPSDDDEDFLNLAIPAILEVTEENALAAFILADKLNATAKYVKANRLGGSIWLFYERELYGGEDFEQLLSQMIYHLEAAFLFFRQTMEDSRNGDDGGDEDTPQEDTEEAA